MSTEENIPNIFNYCDNWCEHCAFCNRCEVAKMNEEPLPVERVTTFQERLSDFTKRIFTAAEKELKKLPHAKGETIIFELIVEEENKNERKLKSIDSYQKLPLTILSSKYIYGATILVRNKLPLRAVFNKILQHMDIGILSGSEATEKSKRLNKSLTEIVWYQDLIHVKLFAATKGLNNGPVVNDANNIYTNYNGHAKIALIAIEQSLQAWIYIHSIIDEQEDEIIEQLSTLQKMKKLVEETFPDAWNFKRPGFDD